MKKLAARRLRRFPPRADSSDERFMREALIEASKARREGEVPVGAVIVAGGKIIARAGNRPISSCDPSAHAEMLAIRSAARKIGNYRLDGAEIFVTKEPCAMCAGAMVHARLYRLVFGCFDEKSGAAGSVFNIVSSNELNHRLKVKGGVQSSASSRILKSFFKKKRNKAVKKLWG